jgi:hypothetical protein
MEKNLAAARAARDEAVVIEKNGTASPQPKPVPVVASGPRTLENLLNSNDAQYPAAAAEADATDAAPKRPAGTVARPRDGIQHPDLDKAWTVYDAAVTKAAEGIRAAINKLFDAATAKGDLDAAEKWQKAQEKFKRAGEVPAETDTKSAVTSAVADYKRAKDELLKTYESVVKSLTMEKNLAAARAARDEAVVIEKNGTASPQPKPVPVVAKKNLLLDCDVTRDAISGKWAKAAEAIQSDGSAPAKMKLPLKERLPAQYDFEIEFTPLGGELCVTQLLSAFGAGFGCDFGGWGNTVVGFQLVDGRMGDNNRSTTRRHAWLAAGRRHVAVIQVRRNSVAAFLDGQHVVTMPTDYRNLQHRNDWSIPVDSIGIGSWATPTLFHRASVLPK